MLRQHFYNHLEQTDVISFVEFLIKKALNKENQSEANNLITLKKDLLFFKSKELILFNQIDYDFVNDFIQTNLDLNRNNTTIAFKLRYLRKILNEAIRRNIGSKASYPFSNKYGAIRVIKISKFEKVERKLAINNSTIDILKNTSFTNKNYETARRLFISSYAARGMNFRDLALLTTKNVVKLNGNLHLSLNRNKTNAPINFKISSLLQEQIAWFSKNCNLTNEHLFPIIEDTEIDNLYSYLHKKLNSFNYYLKKIAQKLELDTQTAKLSSYTARHTFATKLHHNNVDINIISQALSHQNVTTTKAYLKKFDENIIDSEIEKIIG